MNKTKQKIKDYMNIEDGWHFGAGSAPDEKIINNALIINEKLIDLGFPSTDSFLSEDGDIQVNGYWNNYYLETIVDSDGTIDFIIEKNSNEIVYEERLMLGEILKRIEFWGSKWYISDLSKHHIMTNVFSAFSLQPSVFRATGDVQLFKWTALKLGGKVSANTSKNITRASTKNLLYTLGSPEISFPKAINL